MSTKRNPSCAFHYRWQTNWNQWVSELVNEWGNEWMNERMNEWINQSINQLISEFIKQLINQSINQLFITYLVIYLMDLGSRSHQEVLRQWRNVQLRRGGPWRQPHPRSLRLRSRQISSSHPLPRRSRGTGRSAGYQSKWKEVHGK